MNDSQRIVGTFVKIKKILEQDERLAQYEKNARQIRLDNMAVKDPKSALPFLRLDQEQAENKPGFVGPPSSAMGQENLDKHLLKQAELRRERRAKGLKESNSDAERAKADARTLQRYGAGTEASEIKRMGLSDDQVAGLPEDPLQRAKALQKLSVQRAYSNAADTARNFGLNDETAELARSAANQLRKAEGEGRSFMSPEKFKADPDILRQSVRSYLDSKNSQSAEAMNAARASDRARSARTGVPVGQGVEGVRSEAEVSARMAEYEKGARQARLDKMSPKSAVPFIKYDIDKTESNPNFVGPPSSAMDAGERDQNILRQEQQRRERQGFFGSSSQQTRTSAPMNTSAPKASPSPSQRQPSPSPAQRQGGVGFGPSEPFMDVRNQTGTSSSINRSPTVGQTGLGIMASRNQQTQSGIRPMA